MMARVGRVLADNQLRTTTNKAQVRDQVSNQIGITTTMALVRDQVGNKIGITTTMALVRDQVSNQIGITIPKVQMRVQVSNQARIATTKNPPKGQSTIGRRAIEATSNRNALANGEIVLLAPDAGWARGRDVLDDHPTCPVTSLLDAGGGVRDDRLHNPQTSSMKTWIALRPTSASNRIE
ncbi:hypothetical protein B0O99DRAFT_678123 [Bisporella sp. PMI_857]|nr:hypothetical protein B0O99DRAFT_678123 [Bisporella sp. PMI_857]